MKVRRVSISNFRGMRSGSVLLDTRSLLVGGNAVGKSTVCEALDLVLGLERLYRRPVIDEYDFHQALYRGGEPGGPIRRRKYESKSCSLACRSTPSGGSPGTCCRGPPS